MERLKQIFNNEFDINKLIMTKAQSEIVITVWSEHFKKQRPRNVCLGTFRNICRQLHSEHVLFKASKPTKAAKIESIVTDDLSSKSLGELKAIADNRGIKYNARIGAKKLMLKLK